MGTAYDHESDFVGWTEHQAAVLKDIPVGTLGLDTANLAEEIADLGRSEIRETSSLLRQVLLHLIKLAVEPDAAPASHWVDEALAFQGDAVLACSPGIRQRIDLAAIWRLACNGAVRSLKHHGGKCPDLPSRCPLALEALLDSDFDPLASATAIGAAIQSSAASRGAHA